MESEEIKIPCIVERVTFSKDNGFCLLACTPNPYSQIYNKKIEEECRKCINRKYNTFTVSFTSLEDGDQPEGNPYIFVGKFVTHPKYGRQFESNYGFIDTPDDERGFKSFLMSLPHIKDRRADEILKRWTVIQVRDILTDNPMELCQINGLTESRVRLIKNNWDKHNSKMQTYLLMSSAGFSSKVAEKAFKFWGINAFKILNENPYSISLLPRISFADADLFAHKIAEIKGEDISDEKRMEACITHVLAKSYSSDSQLCIPYSNCKDIAIREIESADSKIGKKSSKQDHAKVFIDVLKKSKGLFACVRNLRKNGNPVYIYTQSNWQKECLIGSELANRSKEISINSIEEKDVEYAENIINQFYGGKFSLDEMQKEAIRSAFNEKVTVITGGGGTGKTTICKCIYNICQNKRLSIRMMSPTGRAAQVLSEKTGGTAQTIHRALKILPGDDFSFEELKCDIVLVDEISMCGIDTIYALMRAIKNNPDCNLVLVGDKDQLPSVSPGNFLSDIISSEVANVVRLNKIHRQDEKSYISILANKIAKGEAISIPQDASDISWKTVNTDEVGYLVDRLVDSYLKSNDIKDLQIISPMKKGSCGVFKLNSIMQDKMKKINRIAEAESIERGFDKYYVGDRVIQLENNYEKDIFNGDMGHIISLGTKRKDNDIDDENTYQYVTVDFYGKNTVTYYGEEIEQLQLGWVITVHKFQGSQSKNIILFLASEANIMMSKELVYTGFTRAEKKLVVIGHKSCLDLAVSRSSLKLRYTNLIDIIKEVIDPNSEENFKVLMQ